MGVHFLILGSVDVRTSRPASRDLVEHLRHLSLRVGSRSQVKLRRPDLDPARSRSTRRAWLLLEARVQCVVAPAAPMPVWQRTYWASNPPRSTLARALRSKTENSQMPANAIVIENSAGLSSGTGADPLGLPSVASHTAGDRMTPTTALIRPRKPPIIAPRVVSPFQKIDMTSTGKLHDAAMAKASPTMKATFWFSNMMPRMIASTPRNSVAIFETRISSCALAFPSLITMA